MSFLSKLACCCTSSGRKEKTQEDSKAPSVSQPASVTPAAAGGEEYAPLSDEMIMASIRDIAFSLVKRSTVAIVQARIIGNTPNEAFPPALGRELSKIVQHPDFDELVKVITQGPSEENKATAEKLANGLAVFLINEAEKECPLILNNDQ